MPLADTYLSCDSRPRTTPTYLELVEYGYWLKGQTRKSIFGVDVRFCLDDIWLTCLGVHVFTSFVSPAGSVFLNLQDHIHGAVIPSTESSMLLSSY